MNLSISNIAWLSENDIEMYQFLKDQGFTGLEIAPTRIFPQNPYDENEKAKEFATMLKSHFGLCISSMQSIWYGISENIFGSDEDRQKLISYTKKAVDFAKTINCKNLVFGCPKNRNIDNNDNLPLAIDFFREIGDYAFDNETTISIEPNPTIYNTNFINTTSQAFEICNTIDNKGIKVNIDFGTIIYNNEDLEEIFRNFGLVNHIHISEPNLELIQKRDIHKELKKLSYDKFVSIEMKNLNDISLVKETMKYIKGVLA